MNSRHIVVAILTVLSLGCVLPAATPGAPSRSIEYHVAPPDVLLISVRPEPEITREVTVRPDGYISLDLIHELRVEGKTVDEIRGEITKTMEAYIVSPDVTVLLSQSNSRHYSVFGEVQRPGSYPLTGRVTAVQALASAGGPTRFASMGAARLARPSEGKARAYAVNLDRIALHGSATTNYELQPGDVLYVPPNLAAQIGYGIGIVLFPFQQIIGLGRGFVSPVGN